jgi:hypothetical protein
MESPWATSPRPPPSFHCGGARRGHVRTRAALRARRGPTPCPPSLCPPSLCPPSLCPPSLCFLSARHLSARHLPARHPSLSLSPPLPSFPPLVPSPPLAARVARGRAECAGSERGGRVRPFPDTAAAPGAAQRHGHRDGRSGVGPPRRRGLGPPGNPPAPAPAPVAPRHTNPLTPCCTRQARTRHPSSAPPHAPPPPP